MTIIKSKPCIKKIRMTEGYGQTEAAKLVNLSSTSYCLIENGKMGAKPKTAKAICTLFKKEFDELFEIMETPRKEERHEKACLWQSGSSGLCGG